MGPDLRAPLWPDSASRPLGHPIQPSVVYVAADPDAWDAQYEGRTQGQSYAREGHPNAQVLARRLDALEGATGGLVVGSGMAAVTAGVMGVVRAGDHVLGGTQLYGRSLRLLSEDLPRFGVETSTFDPTDAESLRAALKPTTRAVLVEVVSNPTLRVADMAAIAEVAQEVGCLLIVDNTFTTPRAVQAFALGADIVVHSITKMLAGHSDVTLGYVAARDPALRTRIESFAITLGLTASPFDCWLAERGLATFALRYDQAERNAARIADLLAETPGVTRVLYPGRADHPDRVRAAALLQGRFGTMVTFDVDGGREAANALARRPGMPPLAPTLGDVATTLSHPASSSHRALTPAARAALGISEGTFRMSVGIEDTGPLLDRLARAFGA